MIPPDRNHLRALAGWSLSAQDQASPQQELALAHFRCGCDELSNVIDEMRLKRIPADPMPEASWSRHEPDVCAPARAEDVLLQAIVHRPKDEQGKCVHKFDIRTQKCKFCGVTYRKAHGRDPELM